MFHASSNLSSSIPKCAPHGASGEAFDETLAFFHRLNVGGESKHATVESAFLILQVVTTTDCERSGQSAVRNRVTRRIERELHTLVKLLAVREDLQLAAKHAAIKLDRLSGIAGERNVKRCLHARQCGRKLSSPRLTVARQSPAEYTVFSLMKGVPMATMTIRMDDNDAELVRKYARFEGVTISDFARDAILEKIEDAHDLQELRDAIAHDTGERYSLDEILADLDQ